MIFIRHNICVIYQTQTHKNIMICEISFNNYRSGVGVSYELSLKTLLNTEVGKTSIFETGFQRPSLKIVSI